ncbi:hypothetical protein NBG4_430016 [Candidatus Sulfobium mesophilum]|uniref:Uncharacterized protein n=1 Tax=Candidatus Sulfobium mesophilum TaxID=2016548 RepID=A0A2U3QI85_9BACT|nr:hypothetical protein NBG4_430016 [Candidatus Sulfobium mesophilum]
MVHSDLRMTPATVNILKTDLTFQAFPIEEINEALSTGILHAGVQPWRANTTDPIDESLFGAVPMTSLPDGTYSFYMLVTPAGSLNTYYLWSTFFSVAAEPDIPAALAGLTGTAVSSSR